MVLRDTCAVESVGIMCFLFECIVCLNVIIIINITLFQQIPVDQKLRIDNSLWNNQGKHMELSFKTFEIGLALGY